MKAELSATIASLDDEAERISRRKRALVRDCGVVALSYAVDGIFLVLFAMAGTVHWSASLVYLVPGVATCAAVAWLIGLGRTLHLQDPSLTIVQDIGLAVGCLLGLLIYPQIGFLFFLTSFFALLTATYRIPMRQVAIIWGLIASVGGAAVVYAGDGFTIPQSTAMERFLVWAIYSISLGRCVVLILFNISINLAIGRRGKQMTVALEQIEHLANHDELTGVLNRRSLMRTLDEETARFGRTSAPLSVALLDIDRFKAVNDKLGHLVGDQVLKRFAKEISGCHRVADRFGRYGGEEFLLIMADTDEREAQFAIERVREWMNSVDWSAIVPDDFRLGFSAGVARWHPGDPIEQTLRHADQALYDAKEAGRNCTRTWQPDDGPVPAPLRKGPDSLSQQSVPADAAEAPSSTGSETAAADSAQQSKQRLLKRTRFHLTVVAIVIGSYCIDAAFLWLLSPPGAQGWRSALGYLAMGVSLSTFFAVLIASGLTWRFKDINLTVVQGPLIAIVQLVCMVLWPQLGVVFLLIMFLVFVMVTTRLSVREAVIIWGLISAGVAVAGHLAAEPLRLPGSGVADRALVWAFFALTLGRCVLLGGYNSSLRVVLRKRGVELAQLTAKLRHLARHDELTGVLNRRSLLEALRNEQQRADRSGIPVSVAVLDIDHFKAVNDKLGHLAGDKALKIFAFGVQKHTRAADTFGRYGGEEFLLVFFNTTAEAAQLSLERMRNAMASWNWSEVAPDFKLTFSAGVSAHRSGESAEELLRRADKALYRAKGDGRNCSRLG